MLVDVKMGFQVYSRIYKWIKYEETDKLMSFIISTTKIKFSISSLWFWSKCLIHAVWREVL